MAVDFSFRAKKHARPWLLEITSASASAGFDMSEIGGKASRLHWLARHGFSIPETWVLPAAAFREILTTLPPACEPRSLLRAARGRSVYVRAADAREAFLGADLPEGVEEELARLWRKLENRAPWGLAVRSSATSEDGALSSLAGMADTKLGVFGPEGLARAVRDVWASLASGRALTYLAARHVKDVSMAVVIQPVVTADAAGVLFTRAPGRAKHRIVNAGFGLGTPVVDGVSTPDVLLFDEEGAIVEQTIAHKPEKCTIDSSGGVVRTKVPNPDAPAIDEAALQSLARIANELERLSPIGWDVEFARIGNETVLLQARPVTGRGFPEGGTATTVWSNLNIGEALPGVATTLTWAIAGAFSDAGFRQAFATLGCSVPKSAVLVGNVHGRFYLNLSDFMRVAAQVPWLDPRTLVELGGGGGGAELALEAEGVSHRGFYARLPLTASRVVKEQLALDRDVEVFEDYATKALRRHRALDLGVLPDEGVARRLREAQSLLERTGTMMLSCASSSLAAHLALKTMLARSMGPEADSLARDLVRGIRDLESARPGIAILRLAELARREPLALAALVAETPPSGMPDLPDGPTKRALDVFLERFGDRAVREAEISTPRWKEDPRVVLSMLRIALKGEAISADATLARAHDERDRQLAKLLAKLGIVQHTVVRHLVARAQKGARLRERMRAWVTRVLGIVREIALEAEDRIIQLMPELREDELASDRSSPLAIVPSVFFFTADEISEVLRDSRTDFVPLVRARRAEYLRDLGRPDPPATFVGVPPPLVFPAAGDRTLTGLPASSGVVEGLARVLSSANEMDAFKLGEILVVHTTDVGWTPLFPLARGVVTELGGPLSHAAIVAREFGVPSVVNVAGATRALRTGQRIRVDGDRGVVEVLS